MAMRPRRPGIARTLSERARAKADAPAAESAPTGLGGLLDGLREMAEKLGRMASEAGGDTASGEREIDLGGGGRMVFGYSLRTGLDAARAEPFGHVPERGAKPTPDTARQPIVDVFEEAESIVVVAEIPGASESGIACRMEGGDLLIEASGARSYRKRLTLPGAVDPASLRSSLRNGILEITLRRAPART
jgi:HSP20 family protein